METKNTTTDTSSAVILINSCRFESIERIKNTPMMGRNVISERIGKDIQILQNYEFRCLAKNKLKSAQIVIINIFHKPCVLMHSISP